MFNKMLKGENKEEEMGRYLNEANYCFKEIKHFHTHGGKDGYRQAIGYYSRMIKLRENAMKSKKGQNDGNTIAFMLSEATKLMNEMKERASNEEKH